MTTGSFICDVCGRQTSSDFVFLDGKRRCPRCAALYFHGALDRMEEQNATTPTDESLAPSSTSTEVSCEVCGGAAIDDNSDACGNCGGSGKVRPARVDPKPTIAPGTLRADRCEECGGKVNYVSPWDGWRCTRCGRYHGGKARK